MLLSLQPVFVVRGLKNNLLGLPGNRCPTAHPQSEQRQDRGRYLQDVSKSVLWLGDAGRGVSDQVEGGSLTTLDLCS